MINITKLDAARPFAAVIAVALVIICSGCASTRSAASNTVPLAENVDLSRYAGDWYLVAHIPTSRDYGAHNALENYAVQADGSIAITYRNRLGGFDGNKKLMTPTARVLEGSGNALWNVVFGWYWPFPYEYRIAHLEPDYSAVIVARSKRDYMWIFSRTPEIAASQLERYLGLLKNWGYEVSKTQLVPQRWPNPADRSHPELGPH